MTNFSLVLLVFAKKFCFRFFALFFLFFFAALISQFQQERFVRSVHLARRLGLAQKEALSFFLSFFLSLKLRTDKYTKLVVFVC